MDITDGVVVAAKAALQGVLLQQCWKALHFADFDSGAAGMQSGAGHGVALLKCHMAQRNETLNFFKKCRFLVSCECIQWR
jgi:hypothetical protein